MKKTALLLAAAILASCSTMKVATNVVNQYPVSVAPHDVAVYEPGDPLPPQVEELGTVTVFDDGSAKKEPLDTTIFRAQKAVSENGGNGLKILEFRTPAESGSANYQIYGAMLLTQGEPEEIKLDPESKEGESDGEASKAYSDFAKASEAQEAVVVRSTLGRHNIYGGVGYQRITSKFQPGDGVTITKGDPQNEINFNAGYEFVTRKGLSFGLCIQKYNFGYDGSAVISGTPATFHDGYGITSFLGTFGYVEDAADFCITGRFGLGYASCREIADIKTPVTVSETATNQGLAMVISLSALYKLSETFGVGLDVSRNYYTFNTEGEALCGQAESLGIGLVLRASF